MSAILEQARTRLAKEADRRAAQYAALERSPPSPRTPAGGFTGVWPATEPTGGRGAVNPTPSRIDHARRHIARAAEPRQRPGPGIFGGLNFRVFATTQSNSADLLDRQPLVMGAIGLGVGAAMAAALPSTAVETGLLGQASADLQARTHEIAGQVTDRAADLADGVTAAVTNEAKAQGLTYAFGVGRRDQRRERGQLAAIAAPRPGITKRQTASVNAAAFSHEFGRTPA